MAIFQRDIYTLSAGTIAFSGSGNRTVTFTGIGSGLAVPDGAGNLVSKFGKGATLRVGMAVAQVATVDSATQLTLAHDVSSPMTGSGVSYILTTATADEALIAGILASLMNKGQAANPFDQLVFDNGTHRSRIISNGGSLEWRVGPTGNENATNLVMSINPGTGAPTISGFVTSSQVRDKLTGNRTYYVRTDGNDSNTGLTNTSGGAFLTIQKAINVVASLDIGIYNVTIQLGTGTFTAGGVVTGPWVGSGEVSLVGNGSANTTINITNGKCLNVKDGGRMTVSATTYRATTTGQCLYTERRGTIEIGTDIVFGASTSCTHMWSEVEGIINIRGGYTISGSAASHMVTADGGRIIHNVVSTVTVSGTPAWSISGIYAQRQGSVLIASVTYSGSATGVRHIVNSQAQIFLASVSGGQFPGNSAGSADAGSFGLFTSV